MVLVRSTLFCNRPACADKQANTNAMFIKNEKIQVRIQDSEFGKLNLIERGAEFIELGIFDKESWHRKGTGASVVRYVLLELSGDELLAFLENHRAALRYKPAPVNGVPKYCIEFNGRASYGRAS